MLDIIIKTEKFYEKSLKDIHNDYIIYCVDNDFTTRWGIQRFEVLLNHLFENDLFENAFAKRRRTYQILPYGWDNKRYTVLLKHAFDNDFDAEAWKFSGFLFDKDYLKEVEIETGDEYETENRGVQASTSA